MINPDIARIERAKEERRKQLTNWEEYDRTYQHNHHNKSRKRESKHVGFGPEIMFLEAAARGDVVEVKKLLKGGVSPDVTNEDGLTALHQCCIDNNVEMCNLLLENNANVNAQDNELWTPLHAAATCGNKDLCGILINWGADLLALNVDGNMPYDLCDDEDTLILVENEMAKRNVTQKQIDDLRLLPEQDMLNDLKRRYAAGDDFQALDSQGASPV
ncbi:Protein phosphatase 1 regulatory inhibitor subunit 16B [Taenia solium]|eukprot:TsM_000075900 transcript=TsM_000075900 gene=TsM_000075900